jgi:hypothetical protein
MVKNEYIREKLNILPGKLKHEKNFDIECVIYGKGSMDPMVKVIMKETLADEASGELVLIASTNEKVCADKKDMMALRVRLTFANNKDLSKHMFLIFHTMEKLGKYLLSRILIFRNMNDSSETRKAVGR